MGPGIHQQVTIFVLEGLSLIKEIDGETESFFFFFRRRSNLLSLSFFLIN